MRYLKERKEVMETAREIFKSRLVSGTWGNVSAKAEACVIITPSGMEYDTLAVDDMVLLDGEGNILESKWKPSLETPLHIEIYKNRPDIGAVVHVHSLFATAFAVAGQKIPVIIEEAAQVIGHDIEVATYAHCGSRELAYNTLQALGGGRAVLLANHGLVGTGKSLAEALQVCYVAEKTAQMALYARQLGSINSLAPADINILNQNFQNYGQKKRG